MKFVVFRQVKGTEIQRREVAEDFSSARVALDRLFRELRAQAWPITGESTERAVATNPWDSTECWIAERVGSFSSEEINEQQRDQEDSKPW